jgi:hypothetical protein
VPIDRDDAEERKARIDMILEELRLNTEDMRELAKQATERARKTAHDARATVEKSRALRAGRKR